MLYRVAVSTIPRAARASKSARKLAFPIPDRPSATAIPQPGSPAGRGRADGRKFGAVEMRHDAKAAGACRCDGGEVVGRGGRCWCGGWRARVGGRQPRDVIGRGGGEGEGAEGRTHAPPLPPHHPSATCAPRGVGATRCAPTGSLSQPRPLPLRLPLARIVSAFAATTFLWRHHPLALKRPGNCLTARLAAHDNRMPPALPSPLATPRRRDSSAAAGSGAHAPIGSPALRVARECDQVAPPRRQPVQHRQTCRWEGEGGGG
jgi:hypothetical protein